MRFLTIFLLLFIAHANAQDRAFYFRDKTDFSKHISIGDKAVTFKAGSLINLLLEARTLSVEDRGHFVPLVVDDYRYGPGYFTDKRVPNIIFEITTPEGKPVPFRVMSNGGGIALQYLEVNVMLEIGGDPAKLEAETKKVMIELAAKTITADSAQERLAALQKQLAPNQHGTYKVCAHYKPRIPGKWDGELVTPPITIVIDGAN